MIFMNMKGDNDMGQDAIHMHNGIVYSMDKTEFRIWAPTKEEVFVCVYANDEDTNKKIYSMKKSQDGKHHLILYGNYDGYFYTFLIDGNEITDPYSIASSMNSKRSAIINLEKTNPLHWDREYMTSKTDIPIIYELHIKDYTFQKNSGVKFPGKFLGLAEQDTNFQGYATGLKHLKELGVTHIQIMPIFDFSTLDENEETFYVDSSFNWGYDPELYNVPEGSYCTDPKDPYQRVEELKTLIQTIHEEGMMVIMDVVYNHTYRFEDSNFQRIVPNYYYRFNDKGVSNGSGCGNEIATEREMTRQFILDSLKYWMKEYQVDGFRFDLFGLTDKESMKYFARELRKINPNCILYGEPWGGGESVLPYELRSVKGTQKNLSFGMFNDEFRDAIKGDNDGDGKGYIQGCYSLKNKVESGIAGSIDFDPNHIGFCQNADETINYVNSHDNLILADKMRKPIQEDPYENERYFMAFAILLTSFGFPFIHEGNEFMRTKQGYSNTYNLPNSINSVDWNLRVKNADMVKSFKELIALRKSYKVFSLVKAEDIKNTLKFFHTLDESIIGYSILLDLNRYLIIFHHVGSNTMNISKELLQNHLKKQIIKQTIVWEKMRKTEILCETDFMVDPVETMIIEVETEKEGVYEL